MIEVSFENSRGEERVLSTVETREEAWKVINEFLDEHNYKPPYIRTWERDKNIECIDTGSHVEFFYFTTI